MNKRTDPRHDDLLSGLGEPPSRPPAPARREALVLSVSALVSSARIALERHFGLVWVSGEISNFSRAPSGHCYFNLKDAQAQVRCVFFRAKAQLTKFALQDGLQVEVRAGASMYEARGEFQLNVEAIRLAGAGLLYERFALLKARLAAAGWFAQERKRPLPAYPRAVGIVTSPAAAALRDVLTLFARRWPHLRVVIYPCAVQGGGAAHEIARAIRIACRHAQVDVLIVCRGGGSIEDLWAYNEEAVAKAIFESTIPVVSGVGHETDFTICDFVADIRAATPTAAAVLVTPDREVMRRALTGQAARWQRIGRRTLEMRMQRLDGAARRLVHPAARLAQQARDVGALRSRLERALRHLLLGKAQRALTLRQRLVLRLRAPLPQAARLGAVRDGFSRGLRAPQQELQMRVEALKQSLAHLNPQAVLERGYAIVTSASGDVVSDAARLVPGDDVALRLARGAANATIRTIDP